MSVAALEFATPMALWSLAVGVPLVLGHLYFRKRRARPVPFLALLQESLGPIRRQARFKKLYDALALCCRLIALACVVFALAGLRPAEAQRVPEDVAFVLDADITTLTREADGRVRFEHGLELLRAHVRALPATPEGLFDRVAIVRAGRVPSLLVRSTKDREVVLKGLASVPGAEAVRADLSDAVRMALHAVEHAPKARVVVVTSRGLPAVELPENRAIETVGTGRTRADQTISDFDVGRSIPDGLQYLVRLQIRNDDDVACTRVVRARLRTLPVWQETAEIPAGETADFTFKIPAPNAPAPLTVELMEDDVFPVGDRVEAQLHAGIRPRVIVVHDGRGLRPYTAAALSALGDQIDQERSGTVKASEFVKATLPDVTVVDGAALPKDALRPGAYVFLAPLAGALPFTLEREVNQPLVWRSERSHPLTRGLDFGAAYAVRGWALRGEGMRALAWVEGEPVVAEGEHKGVRYVVLALDPKNSAMPLQKTFPLLLRNAIRRLVTAPRVPLESLYRVGDSLRPKFALPGGPDAEIRWDGWGVDDLIGGNGDRRFARVSPTGGTWKISPHASGRAQIRTGKPGEQRVVARVGLLNLDPTRSVIPVHVRTAPPPPSEVVAPREQRWRTALIALALLFLLLDLALLRPRRRRVLA